MSPLYLHIPFCHARCDYCAFHSVEYPGNEIADLYVDRLIGQFEGESEYFGIEAIPTVYIGGGTPSAMPLATLESLLSGIASRLPAAPSEWTLEANPEDISPELLRLLTDMGVTRLSVGIQSLDEASRRFLGRRGGLRRTHAALDLLAAAWRGRLSLDFIRGLPPGTGVPLSAEFAQLPLRPTHLSLYDLTVEDGTPLRRRLTGADIEEAHFDEDPYLLSGMGLERYEVSSYARKGEESLHNQGYWEMREYLGVGSGAASLMRRDGVWLRREGKADLDRRLSGDIRPGEGFVPVKPLEFFMDHLIMGVRQVRGLDLELIDNRFGGDLREFLPRTTEDALRNGEAEIVNGRLRLTGPGFDFQNRFLRRAWTELDERNCFA